MSHPRRLVAIWLIASAVAVPLIVVVLGPHLPPGSMSTEAADQRDANTRLTALMAPIVLLVLIGFGYSLVAFRARGSDGDGRPIFGHARTQAVWLIATSTIVIALAAWGSWTLIVSAHGAGGGQGPDPIALPNGYQHALQVQVIGQQWNWTYRFPAFGGLETAHLELPANADVELHVTSLDVTHSFWAYELGIKADAVPGADNIAFVHPRKLGTFSIRCAELCGLWHGHMFQTGEVVSPKTFVAWIASQQQEELPNLRYLPAYDKTYYPEPLRRAG
jgi:cytochrome c oxidase subunit II